ncbi:MAG: ATP-dependent Clp protease ATP-binding subunit ClpA [Proteobacteria bacterium]|nr:ATP-dependent Clp protease ATP-binding subunit ClpA [Pseudomonadota bacterium]
MLSESLRIALGFALQSATEERHEFLTLEHLLLGLLHDPDAAAVLEACGGNLQTLEASLRAFIAEFESIDPEGSYEPTQTLGFRRVLQRAIMHVQSSGKEEVQGGNLLVAMFAEPESHAVFLLEEQGITRLDVVSFISHGVRKDGKQRQLGVPVGTGPDAEQPVAEDALDAYTIDLFEKAKAGKIDPLIGRETEVHRALQVLGRRRKNNPVFVGDAGVGKTAIVEGLARMIYENNVHKSLEGVHIYSLDMGALLAGTRFRGDFEERLKAVLAAVVDNDQAILFIDEIHTLVGAGSTSGGSMDASNLLKPALSDGSLRCIGSTTHDEFRRAFTKDKALARRFEMIEVVEPTEDEALLILRGLQPRYEKHHGVVYTPEALEAAVKLSSRHVMGKRLPDKAIDVMDESGSRAKLADETSVDVDQIEETVATIARIPPRRVSTEDEGKLANLEEDLKRVIFGQDAAIETISTNIKVARAGIGHQHKPVGSFLFAGPTGVGKTELAKQLAHTLGLEFIKFDMSEYMEQHTVSRLIGAPPGYVGHDQGGQLTDAIHKTPHCVLVMDEIEKAHPSIFNILLQVMDSAELTDTHGRRSDFRNVILIMTTNAGARESSTRSVGFGGGINRGKADAAIKRMFPPEFRNRLDAVVGFNGLPEGVIMNIVDKFLVELEQQLEEREITLVATDRARAFFAEKGFSEEFGAREMSRVIQEHVKRNLAEEILFGSLKEGGRAEIDLVEGEVVIRSLGRRTLTDSEATEEEEPAPADA